MSIIPTASDAWLLGRIQAHDDVHPEQLDSISSRWKPMARNLAAKPLSDRVAIFQTMLDALPEEEASALETAIDAVDSDGPPPSPEAIEVDSWGPLRIGDLPEVEPFPIDVLPPALAELVQEGARSIGCPPDFLAVPSLAVAGGVIGRSVSLLLKSGYFASSTVWVAQIGIPSDGKSPAQATMGDPLKWIDRLLQEEHEQAKSLWAEECESTKKSKGAGRTPAPPRPRRIDVDDTTIECLINRLSDNPRGLVMVHDELTILLTGMNQYKAGKGNDKPTACKIWSGQTIKRDRVLNEFHEPIRCLHPSLSIAGAMTPDMLGEMIDAKGRGDGFMDRFLFAYPDALPSPEWSDDGIPDDVAEGWSRIVGRLWERPLAVCAGRDVPHVAYMTPGGKSAWTVFYAEHTNEMNDPGFPPSLRGPWGKLREYAGRFALILTLLDHAADPTADPVAVPDVDTRHIRNAWRLVTYFKSHARRVYAAVRFGVAGHEALAIKAIVKWLRDGSTEEFTERDVKRARPWIDSETLTRAISHLIKMNAIRPRESTRETAKPGRPPSPTYDVNPTLLMGQN